MDSQATGVPIDQEARHRIAAVHDVSFAVEAGAGTGKTTVLVSRIMELIASGTAGLRNICAITFTDKAAAELRLRLREELEDRLATGVGEARTWEKALSELEGASISTIHSFAARLLRERPIEAGVDPGFDQHDANQSALFWRECWNEWLRGQLNEKPYPEVLREALRLGVSLEDLRETAHQLTTYRDVVRARPPFDVPEADVAAFKESFCNAIEKLFALAREKCVNPGDDRGYRHLEELVARAGELRGLDGPQAVELLDHELQVKALGNQSNWAEAGDCRLQKTLCRDLEEERGSFLRRYKNRLTVGLVDWLNRFTDHYDRRKRDRGVLDFDDLLLLARDLLARHPEVRRDFHRQYRYLLVDEFQDTDPLQAELVFLLADGRRGVRDWTEAEPEDGRLFIVGDPKQSIYRFRRADIELYEEAKEKLLARGESPKLVQNFRSVPPIIDWVNHVFGQVIQEAGRYQPEYTPLESFRDEVPGGGVTILYPPEAAGLGDANLAVVRRQEAAYLACLISDRIEDHAWKVYDRELEAVRPAKYGDIGLLFRVNSRRRLYEEALARHGVPYRVEGGRQFFRTQEVQSLSAVLWAIDHPHDELAVIAALRSSFFGCSDADLFRWRNAVGGFDYLAREAGDSPLVVGEALRLMARLHRLRVEQPPHRVIETLLDETKVLESQLLAPYGDQGVANLYKVLERAREFFMTEHRTFGWFARWLRDMREDVVAEEESPVAEEGEDAVQLLTMHKAKGLEFAITILADMAGGRRTPQVRLVIDRQAQTYEASIGKKSNGFETPGYAGALQAEGLREEAERRRVFYVACTRARDHLVMPMFYGKTPSSRGYFQDYMIEAGVPAALGDDGDPGELPPGTQVVRGETLTPAMEDPAPLRLMELRETVAAALDSGATGFVGASEPESLNERTVWAERREQLIDKASLGLTLVTPSGAVDAEGKFTELEPSHAAAAVAGQAAAFGSAFHALMERCPLSNDQDDQRVVALVAREFGVPGRVAELTELLEHARTMPFMVEALRRGTHHDWLHELPVSLSIEGVLVEGKLDLLIRNGEHATIVDFKTDRVDGAEAVRRRAEHYRDQGALYALMVTEATGLTVDEVIFAFVRPGVEQRLPANTALLDHARERIRELGITGS